MSTALERIVTGKQSISRRRFVQTAAAGGAGAALGLSSLSEVSAKEEVFGQVTLDAIPISYFTASIGSTGIPLWSLKGAYANTVRLRIAEFPELVLKPQPDPEDKIIFAGHAIEEFKSSQLKNGMIMRHKGFSGETFGFGFREVVHKREDTTFFAIFRPRLEITGTTKKPRFRFVGDTNSSNGGALFPTAVSEMQGKNIETYISRETLDSWLAQHVTDPKELVKPRFKLRASTGSVSPGVEMPFELTGDGDTEFSPEKTAVTKSKIIAQTGFTSAALKDAFAVGNHLEVTHSSLQEVEAEDVVRMQVTISRATGGKTDIYWDGVFKTFVIIDAGS